MRNFPIIFAFSFFRNIGTSETIFHMYHHCDDHILFLDTLVIDSPDHSTLFRNVDFYILILFPWYTRLNIREILLKIICPPRQDSKLCSPEHEKLSLDLFIMHHLILLDYRRNPWLSWFKAHLLKPNIVFK